MKKLQKEKNKELAKFWKFHINQWSETSMSQLEYCRQHGLIPHRFTYWKRKFKQQNLPVEFVQITPDPINIDQSATQNQYQGAFFEAPFLIKGSLFHVD